MIKPQARRLGRPPGAVKDCITCRHWIAGTLVLRGNTQGYCSLYEAVSPADSWCDRHTEAPT